VERERAVIAWRLGENRFRQLGSGEGGTLKFSSVRVRQKNTLVRKRRKKRWHWKGQRRPEKKNSEERD